MGLRPHEQRVLDQIERALRACDPKLAGMLSMFTRLEAYERVPSERRPLAVPTAQNAMANRAAACLPGLMTLQSGMSAPNSRPLKIRIVLAIITLLVASLFALVTVGGSHQTSPAACSMAWSGAVCPATFSPNPRRQPWVRLAGFHRRSRARYLGTRENLFGLRRVAVVRTSVSSPASPSPGELPASSRSSNAGLARTRSRRDKAAQAGLNRPDGT
jgi:Protein of unknown function (DUF3040)